jgi:hypothetical protein
MGSPADQLSGICEQGEVRTYKETAPHHAIA